MNSTHRIRNYHSMLFSAWKAREVRPYSIKNWHESCMFLEGVSLGVGRPWIPLAGRDFLYSMYCWHNLLWCYVIMTTVLGLVSSKASSFLSSGHGWCNDKSPFFEFAEWAARQCNTGERFISLYVQNKMKKYATAGLLGGACYCRFFLAGGRLFNHFLNMVCAAGVQEAGCHGRRWACSAVVNARA